MRVKICGLSTPETIQASVKSGATYLGFNFFAKSPRSVHFEQAAALAIDVPSGVCKVALVVNQDNAFLDQLLNIVPIDMVQLHGSETPERVTEVRQRYGLPVMKVIGVSGPEDVSKIDSFMKVADQILVDAKAPKGADLPGGNGVPFDWRLVAGPRWVVPWMLAGGLTPENVAEAVRLTGANQVDVSSGVESAPGIKDEQKIAQFIRAAEESDAR